jgi:hypothetical protein
MFVAWLFVCSSKKIIIRKISFLWKKPTKQLERRHLEIRALDKRIFELEMMMPKVGLEKNGRNHDDNIQHRVARWFVFKQKNPDSGKFLRALERKMFVYFMTIWNIYGHLG